MRNGRKHGIAVSFGGLAGGLLGTAAIQKAMGLSQKLPEPLRMPEMRADPGELAVKRIEEVRGGPLTPKVHARAAHAIHWLYGLAWAGALAPLASRLRMHRLGNAMAAGAAMGAVSWAAGYAGWLPAAGVTRPIAREKASKTAMSLATHLLYGVVAAIPLYAAERLFRRRRISLRWF